MSYRFVDSFRAGPVWSCSKVHLVGFIIKKSVTMHGEMNAKFIYVTLRKNERTHLISRERVIIIIIISLWCFIINY